LAALIINDQLVGKSNVFAFCIRIIHHPWWYYVEYVYWVPSNYLKINLLYCKCKAFVLYSVIFNFNESPILSKLNYFHVESSVFKLV
jgi:hypothetical protein